MTNSKILLSAGQREALLAFGSHCQNLAVNPQTMNGLIDVGMVEFNKDRKPMLTSRGEMAYAYLHDSK
jgi:Mn-dependent DtxR family transcriptional regulator